MVLPLTVTLACFTVSEANHDVDGGRADGHPGANVAPLCRDTSPGELYEQRIAPILAEDRPKSCSQCHLAGIELSNFVRETPCETMACLQTRGLIDFEDPQGSLILTWIDRAQPQSGLITDEIIQQEHDGFLEWIRYGATCFDARCGGVSCGQPGGVQFCDVEPEPYEVVSERGEGTGCDDRTLEALFRDTVYASRQRCVPCHFENEERADPRAPRWVQQAGNCDSSSLATMRGVIEQGYVDVDAPEQSLLLRKPLAEALGGVEHLGHDKFGSKEDGAYLSFKLWIERYAACVNAPTDEARSPSP